MSDADPVVQVRGLRRYFDHGRVHALDGVDLEVDRREWVAITGPSGCGKSTLLHVLAALDAPTAGLVRVLGNDLAGLSDRARFRRTQVGLVFQLHNLLARLTAQQNVEIAMIGACRWPRVRAARARALLVDVGLAHCLDRPVTHLSGGERQRVALARALANEAPLLLADEPTGSLDSAEVDRVLSLISRLRSERGLTVVMATHDTRATVAADRIVRLRDGHLLRAAGPVVRAS